MKIDILNLPDDAINTVTKDNWEEYFDLYMVTDGIDKDGKPYTEYVWTTETMKEFIKKIVCRLANI